MKKIILFLLVLISHQLFAQQIGFLFGEGVRIRSTGSTKGKEVSKLSGLYEVLISEASDQLDGLGKTNDPCALFPWINLKWHPDSAGWVYGKYVYKKETEENIVKEGIKFDVNGEQCHLDAFINYSPPSYNENEGLTGCDQQYLILLFNPGDLSYTPIKDNLSKEGETYLKLYRGEGGGEQIVSVKTENSLLIVETDIYLQDGGAKGVYQIQKKGRWYEVVKYDKTGQ